MPAQPAANLTPSVEEFVGWYNIDDERGDGYPVLRSIETVPKFDQFEFFDVISDAEQWFGRLVEPPPNVPFDPLDQPPFYVRDAANDRTLDIDANFRFLSIPLLRRIQEEFLSRYPLWRIILIAEHPSCSIAIYPNAIRLGSWPVDADPDGNLQQLVRRHLEMQAARERPRREHVAQIQELLPDAVRTIGERPFLVCGVLDNYEGDYRRLTVCLLVRGADADAFTIERPSGTDRDFLWISGGFGVNARGDIISHIEIPATAAFCLVPWMPPADYRGPLTILDEATGKRVPFEIKSENIIRTASAETLPTDKRSR